MSSGDDGSRRAPEFRDDSAAAMRAHLSRRERQTDTQHRLLEDAFERVSTAFSNASLTETRTSYLQLRAALEAHVALEDQVFFPTIRGLQPDLSTELDALSEDHVHVRSDLERLYDLLAVGSREAFGAQFTQFRSTFQGHERREEDLFQRSVRLAKGVPTSS